MSGKRQYPFKAWELRPSFKVVEIELVKKSGFGSHHISSTGGWKYDDELYETKADAISAGRARLDQKEALLAKSLERLADKRAALDKAESQ